jgi:hypothetical protein
MRRNRSRFSSTVRSRYGLLRPAPSACPVLSGLLGSEVVDVGLPRLDQVLGVLIQRVEVVGRVIEVLAPLEAEPADAFLDRVDVLDVFLGRIRVVETQVARPPYF